MYSLPIENCENPQLTLQTSVSCSTVSSPSSLLLSPSSSKNVVDSRNSSSSQLLSLLRLLNVSNTRVLSRQTTCDERATTTDRSKCLTTQSRSASSTSYLELRRDFTTCCSEPLLKLKSSYRLKFENNCSDNYVAVTRLDQKSMHDYFVAEDSTVYLNTRIIREVALLLSTVYLHLSLEVDISSIQIN